MRSLFSEEELNEIREPAHNCSFRRKSAESFQQPDKFDQVSDSKYYLKYSLINHKENTKDIGAKLVNCQLDTESSLCT